MLNYSTFILIESLNSERNNVLNEAVNGGGGFASLKTTEDADKEIEKYKAAHEKAKNAMGGITASDVIQQCYALLKKGKYSKADLKDYDKIKAGLEYAAVGNWTDSEFSKLAKKWVSLNNEEDAKAKNELKKEIAEINDNAEKTFAKSPERMLEIAFRFAGQVKDADEYVKALEAYCDKWDVDMNIKSLCK